MKKFKNIFLAMVGVLTIASCETNADTVAEIKDEAGFLINVSATSNSSILGSPEVGVDLEDATVSITNAYLNMTVSKTGGSLDNLEKIEIVKSFNGGEEIVLGESTTLPYNLVIDNLDDLLSNTGVVESDLRIGDVLSFRTKVTQKDGDVYYYNSSMGNYSLVVNCSSDLAGDYSWGSSQPLLTLEEISPGVYRMPYLGNFASSYWIEFQDVCGILTITDWQYASSNPITQNEPGYVDEDGNLVFPSLDVAGVDWYVGLEVRYTKL
ncbi:hypothetical protein [Tenacibaculum sp. IB213877]|uniref:hypothetical protein n=1 Tax=Tenacibaculum sp. IB213877 TaxID=3097351 RepID=UPI002A5A6607|nr:hypothetical protein [Tenacibaculum sp. IB213877]MDY0780082.1 hypothetical protein [Tenacibaculum sp. IB213877]